jgi:hypothetical protein
LPLRQDPKHIGYDVNEAVRCRRRGFSLVSSLGRLLPMYTSVENALSPTVSDHG